MNQKLGRERMLFAIRSYAEGQLEKHRMNVDVYLENPTGIGEHPDIMEAVTSELTKMAEYHEMLEMVDRYFDRDEEGYLYLTDRKDLLVEGPDWNEFFDKGGEEDV